MNQIGLFETNTRLEQKFLTFHAKNPHVYTELVKLTRQAAGSGRSKIGIQMLIEVVRWNRLIRTKSADFKISNDHAAYYARLIMREHPEFGRMFELRKVKGRS